MLVFPILRYLIFVSFLILINSNFTKGVRIYECEYGCFIYIVIFSQSFDFYELLGTKIALFRHFVCLFVV